MQSRRQPAFRLPAANSRPPMAAGRRSNRRATLEACASFETRASARPENGIRSRCGIHLRGVAGLPSLNDARCRNTLDARISPRVHMQIDVSVAEHGRPAHRARVNLYRSSDDWNLFRSEPHRRSRSTAESRLPLTLAFPRFNLPGIRPLHTFAVAGMPVAPMTTSHTGKAQ